MIFYDGEGLPDGMMCHSMIYYNAMQIEPYLWTQYDITLPF